MLLKAEALTAQGKSSGVAIGLLNQIRERADIGDFDGSVSLQRAILNERARELFSKAIASLIWYVIIMKPVLLYFIMLQKRIWRRESIIGRWIRIYSRIIV